MFARRRVRKFANDMALWCIDRAQEAIEAGEHHESKDLSADAEYAVARAYQDAATELLRSRP